MGWRDTPLIDCPPAINRVRGSSLAPAGLIGKFQGNPPRGAGTGGPVHAHPPRRGHCRRHPAREELRRDTYRVSERPRSSPDAHRRGLVSEHLQRRQSRARPGDRAPDPRASWLAPRLRGERIFEGERIWEGLFASSRGSRDKTFMEAVACVDTALWDLVGKALGQSVLALLGGYRRRLPIISIGGYYMPGKTLATWPRDGELSPRGHGRLQGGRTHTRGGCRASRDGATGGGTGFRPRRRRQPPVVRRGRRARLAPADRADGGGPLA